MSYVAQGTKGAKKGDVARRVGAPGQIADGPSPKQLRELLHVLKGTPAGVVQQVGHLMMLLVAVIKVSTSVTDSGGGGGGSGGGNCGGFAINSRRPSHVVRRAAGRLHGTTTTADEIKQATDLLQHAKKEITRKKKATGAAKAGKAGRCVTNLRGGTDGAEKAKRLQRWAAKGKTNARQLLQLLLGSGAALKARPGLARLLKLHAQRISSEEARKGSSAAAAAFTLMSTTIDGALSDDSRRSTPAFPTPSCSKPDMAVGGQDVNGKPTFTVGQTSMPQQELLKQLPREPLYPMPASFPENCAVESSSTSSCDQETITDKAAAVGTAPPLPATVGTLRSSKNNQPSDIAYVGVGHFNYTPEFVPDNASIVIEASLSPLWSSCSEDSVRGNTTAASMAIEELLSEKTHVVVSKPSPSPLWSSSSEESVRGTAAAAAAAAAAAEMVIEAALSKEAQASSSKRMPHGVEDGVERWPSSGGDADDADTDSLAGKRSTSDTKRGGGDGENGTHTPTPSACTAEVVDDSSAGQPAARQGSLLLDDEVSNTSGLTWVTAKVSNASELTWMTAEGGGSIDSPRTAGVTLEQALVLPPGVTMSFDRGASAPSETLSFLSSGAGSFGDTRLVDNVGESYGGAQITLDGPVPGTRSAGQKATSRTPLVLG